ncbi:ABC transporter permease [Roseibium salinum]|uniref:ABC transporter permease n=1 Tax=Roseibium salinum TaxID=1604349 RepID=A0ABT3R525_9HYPH|nr:ABC transporter permease [Roseibium sp. DSM 29163]MCX2724166.1 ABC transporter permease [Roseibium sp. DSM 29163]MDN3721774.1 ABC transporter permease [Roseibium salinum]
MSAGQLPRWVDYGLIPLLNLAAAFLVSGLVVVLIGENPLKAVEVLVWGSLGYGEGIGFTLFYATNFIFTGLAVAVAFHAGLFNIGGEGQAYLGGLGVAFACLALDRFVPWYVTLPFAILGSALMGAAWALIPAWLQATRGSHVVITTIMFNFIASSLMVYLLNNVLKKPGSMQSETRTFEEGGRLPFLNDIFPSFGFGYAPVNLSLFVALAACVLVWLLIWRTKLGFEIRSYGANASAAVYAGISPVRTIVLTMLISGGLAGMMAINEIMGSQHRLLIDFVTGYGFVGIAVALMGRAHPVGIVLAAVLFGMLYQGGAELSFEMPNITRDMIIVIQGLVILFAGALEHMFRPAIGRFFTPSRALMAKEA